jgi:hypothetical protein
MDGCVIICQAYSGMQVDAASICCVGGVQLRRMWRGTRTATRCLLCASVCFASVDVAATADTLVPLFFVCWLLL